MRRFAGAHFAQVRAVSSARIEASVGAIEQAPQRYSARDLLANREERMTWSAIVPISGLSADQYRSLFKIIRKETAQGRYSFSLCDDSEFDLRGPPAKPRC
jgi:hypothetical protein